MKNYLRVLYRWKAFLIFLGCLLMLSASGLTSSPQISSLSSNRVIALNLILPNNEHIKAIQPEGRMLKVETDGNAYGFILYAGDKQAETISLKAYRIDSLQKGSTISERLIEIESVDSIQVSAIISFAHLPIKIQPVAISKTLNASSMKVRLASYYGPETPCCIVCNGVKTCACGVVASCGSCCNFPCCD